MNKRYSLLILGSDVLVDSVTICDNFRFFKLLIVHYILNSSLK